MFLPNDINGTELESQGRGGKVEREEACDQLTIVSTCKSDKSMCFFKDASSREMDYALNSNSVLYTENSSPWSDGCDTQKKNAYIKKKKKKLFVFLLRR